MSLHFLRALRISSVVFLSVPWLIFIFGWMRPGGAVALLLLHAWVLYQYAQDGPRAPPDGLGDTLQTRDHISVSSLLFITLVAIVWVSLSGAGGVGFQNLPDWHNKNVLMNDLLRYPWPVGYPDGRLLNYYFALYLPAALVGRLAGWNAAQWFLYGEVLVGFMLSLLWLFSFSGKTGAKAALLFLAFGGLDLIGWLATRHALPRPGLGIEWWTNERLQFSSTTTLLFWVPQHCLPGWILTSLILDDASRLGRVTFVGLFVGLCLLWSPFVTLGLIPVAVVALVIAERKSLRSVANFAYWPFVTFLAFAFYAPHHAGADLAAGTAYWADHYSLVGVATMGAFLLLEVGIYGFAAAACWKYLDRSWRAIVAIVAISSVAWVLVPEQVGHGGFTMRSSIPTLLLLFLIILRVLTLATPRPVRFALGACLVLGAAPAVQELTHSIQRFPATIPAPRPVKGVLELRGRQMNEFVMPADSRLYRLFFRMPPVTPP